MYKKQALGNPLSLFFYNSRTQHIQLANNYLKIFLKLCKIMSDKQNLKQKGSCAMKNNQKAPKFITAKKAIAAAAKMATSINVNSTCLFVIHQPKLPKGAEKLRKF